jgi:hypothetical protein
MENTSLDSAPAYSAQITQQPLAESWFLADWPPYLPDLNSLYFSTYTVLQPKGQVTPHANLAALRPSIPVECYRLAIYLQNMQLFPPPPLSRK